MMLWRAVLPSVCRSIAWVAMMTAGVVALAVSVEKVNQGWSTVCTAMQFQVVAALLWLSPLILATGVSLSGLRRRVRGEEQALASAGIGWPHLTPLVLTVGLVSGLLGLCVGEWLLPVVADPNLPGWVWTGVGPVRTADGLNVAIHAGGNIQFVGQVNVGDAFPRLASTSALFANEDVVARTELYARLARVLACVGCAWFGLVADRCRHPLIVVIGSTGLMMVLEAVAWGMAAQSQIPQWVGGGVPAILWVLPSLMCLRQSST